MGATGTNRITAINMAIQDSAVPSPTDQQTMFRHRKTRIQAGVTGFFSWIKKSLTPSTSLRDRAVKLWERLPMIGYKACAGFTCGGLFGTGSLWFAAGAGIIGATAPPALAIIIGGMLIPATIGAITGPLWIPDPQ